MQNGGLQTRFSHLNFPSFNGKDSTGWIQKTDEVEKVLLASFHLYDDALRWYQWYKKTETNVQWQKLTQALCICFGRSNCEDFDEALVKVRNTRTVREYQMQYECLAARVQD